jgi:hypothetical protein
MVLVFFATMVFSISAAAASSVERAAHSSRPARLAAIAAAFSLIGAPGLFVLGVSVMLEVPACSLAVASLATLILCGKYRRTACFSSCLLFCSALFIKLTAVVFLPAILLEVASLTRRPRKSMAIWCTAAAVISSVMIPILVGWHELPLLFESHFTVLGGAPSTRRSLSLYDFYAHSDAVILAAAALVVAFFEGDFAIVKAPATILATAILVHFLHTPWWHYYWLHFAIPLAWLSAYTISRLVMIVSTTSSVARWQIRARRVLAALLLLMFCLPAIGRLRSEAMWILEQPTWKSWPLLQEILKRQSKTHFMFSTDCSLSFFANIPQPPEIAIRPLKRFWCGMISDKYITEVVDKCNAEQLVLRRDELTPDWVSLTSAKYTLAFREGDFLLFILNNAFDE